MVRVRAAALVLAGLLAAGCGLLERGPSAEQERYRRRLEEGRTLARQGQMAEAAEAFEDATYADPDSGEAHYLLARALLELGRGYPARDALQQAERLRPGHPAQRILLGRVLTTLGRLEEAREVLADAVERWPDSPRKTETAASSGESARPAAAENKCATRSSCRRWSPSGTTHSSNPSTRISWKMENPR